MTLAFWLTFAALIGLALVFVLYPLVFHRPEKSAVNDIRHQNLLAYRSRLAELEVEREAGTLDEATFRQMKEELAGSLLDDVGQSEQEAQRVSRRVPGRRSALVIVLASVVLVPAASLLLYNDWGSVDQLEQYQTMLEMRQTNQAQGQQMAELAEQLRQRLLDNPENLEGWAMLGRTYMNLENYAQAAWAYEQLAGQLDDVPAEAATAWGLAAQARFFESRGAMNDKVTGAIAEARERNPNEVNALGLLGINAFERQAYQEAIDYWERIIEVAPDHPQLPSIRQGVAEAYRRSGQPVPDSLAQPAGASVKVRVALSDAFKGEIPPDTALFIFARNAEGGGMPLAVARLTAAQLPTTVTLDDSMAMAPGAKLSGAQSVTLAARLSPSGNAIPQSGDWQGEGAAPVDLESYEGEPVEVVIDQRVP